MNETGAFMKLVERHDRELRALAYRLLNDRVAMDDVMQEAYLKAFRGFSGFRGDSQVGTWLYRIVYNACLDHLRRERGSWEVSLEEMVERQSHSSGDPAADGTAPRADSPWGAAPDDPADLVTGRAELAEGLARLPVDQRAAVLLVDAAGLSYAEAGEVLGVPSGTVASRLNHARSALRETFAEGRGRGTVR